MEKILNKNNLDSVLYLLEGNLKTGLDKITQAKFHQIRDSEFDTIIRKVNNKSYSFTRLKQINKSRVFYIPTIRDRILIELLRISIEDKTRIKYPDRGKIADLIVKKLHSLQNCTVIRLDIKDFFNSIPQNLLVQKLKSDLRYSNHEYYLLKQYCLMLPKKGLPTGISLSSTLSEIYLQDIDNHIKNVHPSISHYIRYVDDILLVINGILSNQEQAALVKKISYAFSKLGLRINYNKSMSTYLDFDSGAKSYFNFLGYRFGKKNKPDITFTDEKIRRIKGKIKFIFSDYQKNSNLELLIERLNYLTKTNTLVRKKQKLNKRFRIYTKTNLIKHGLVHTYKHISDRTWKNLDKYIRGNLHAYLQPIYGADKDLKNRLFSRTFSSSIKRNEINKLHLLDNPSFIAKIVNISPNYSASQLKYMERHKLELLYRKILKI